MPALENPSVVRRIASPTAAALRLRKDLKPAHANYRAGITSDFNAIADD
jgi:hypothetical protein